MKHDRQIVSNLVGIVLLLGTSGYAHAGNRLTVGPAIEIFASKDAYQRTPDVAYGNGQYLVVWQDGWNGAGGDSNILGARLDARGKLLDSKPIEICKAAGIQDSPSVAFLAGEFVVVWADLRNDNDYDLYFARVSCEGKVHLGGRPLVQKTHNQVFPRIASGGRVGLVVWQDLRNGKDYHIYATRIGKGGRILDGDGFQVSEDGANTPTVAASRDAFLVAWTFEHPSTKHLRHIGGARVGVDGKVLGEMPAHTFHGKPIRPAAASDGKDFLFVCCRVPHPNYWGWGGQSAFYGARILADGSAPDIDLISGRAPTGDNRWTYKLFANVLDCSKLHKGIWLHKYSDVAWDGKEYVVVWTRAHIQNRVMLTNFDLIATRIRFPGWQKLDSPTGPIPDKAWELDPQPIPGIPVANTPHTEALPALAGSPQGEVIIVYELHKPDGSIQLVARLLQAD